MKVDTLTSIKVFRQVVESGSFVSAADRLDLSTAMVSKHVMHVEKRLGVRLLNRNSRTLSLTEPGRVYFERCKTILDDLENTELELGSLGSSPRGTLRVTAPTWFAGRNMTAFLDQYRRHYPDVLVDISFDDRVVDLVEEGYDVAMRVTKRTPSAGLVARPVRRLAFPIAASREYLKRRGVPKSPEDLINHDCAGLAGLDSWPLVGPYGKIEAPVRPVIRFRGNAMPAVANAVATGMCIAPLPAIYFEDPVFKGALQAVLTDYIFSDPTLYLVYVSRKQLPLKIRTFIDSFLEFAAQLPEPAVVAA
jgi:DNA-binding transcriptional LysR family regulator